MSQATVYHRDTQITLLAFLNFLNNVILYISALPYNGQNRILLLTFFVMLDGLDPETVIFPKIYSAKYLCSTINIKANFLMM